MAWVASWKDYTKPWVRRQLADLTRKYGPTFLGGSEVDVEQVDFTLGPASSITLEGLTIRNLPPYKPEDLMQIQRLVVEVDLTESVKSKFSLVHVSAVQADGCHLTWDRGVVSSNVEVLLKKMKEKEDAAKVASPKKEATTEVVLHRLAINDIKVKPEVHLLEGQSGIGADIPVPSIEIAEFSQKFGSLTLDKLVTMIVSDILTAATTAVTSVVSVAAQGAAVVTETAAETANSTFSWISSWFS